ncbi:MAG TPA: hypothetical protein VK543_19115, partial [Puia sp.]|nr:hypothetical protein [Puia sp.]
MSEQDHINGPFSAATIRDYLEGKLSDADMHAIEKAAMEDPFLADAIEGMQLSMQQKAGDAFASDVLDLHQRLQDKINPQRNKIRYLSIFFNRQVAVAILVLAGTIMFTYFLIIKDKSPQRRLADKNIPLKTEADSTQNAPAPVTDQTDTAAPPPATPEKSNKNMPPDRTVAKNDKRNLIPGSKADQKSTEEYKPDESLARAGTEKSPDAAGDDRLKKLSAPTRRSDSAKSHTDSLSDPMGSVAQSFAKSAEGKAAPMATRRRQATANSLNEVVVLGNSMQSKKDSEEDEIEDTFRLKRGQKVRIEKAIPASGWKSYNEWLSKNKKINTVDSTIKGNEIVSF